MDLSGFFGVGGGLEFLRTIEVAEGSRCFSLQPWWEIQPCIGYVFFESLSEKEKRNERKKRKMIDGEDKESSRIGRGVRDVWKWVIVGRGDKH